MNQTQTEPSTARSKVITVQETKDYEKFKLLNGNRPIKPAHLRFLKESISKHGDLGSPIIVNNDFEIIDGQHRKLALEELGMPVQYIQKNGFGIKEVHVLNTNRKNWTMIEFMNCYAGVGIKSYIAFKEFYQKFEFAPSIALAIAINKTIGGSTSRVGKSPESFNRGEFVFKDVLGAEDRAAKLMMVKEYYYGYKGKNFVGAMLRLFRFKEYNHSEFLLKVKQRQEMLLLSPNTINAWLRIFEDIYNYRRHGKKVSFYQDLKSQNGK